MSIVCCNKCNDDMVCLQIVEVPEDLDLRIYYCRNCGTVGLHYSNKIRQDIEWHYCDVDPNKEILLRNIQKLNPYPEHLFPEPEKEKIQRMKKAFKDAGLTPDTFYASFGRGVWFNCIAAVASLLWED